MAPLYAPLESFHWYEGEEDERFIFWICVALFAQFLIACAILLFGVQAWYGRYNESSAGINPKLGWFLQEIPTLIAAAVCWATGRLECTASLGNRLVLFCFVAHYVNRSIIYPLRSRGSKPIPLSIVAMAAGYCTVNGYLQCRSLTRFLLIPLWSWSTLAGFALWAVGLYINMDSDRILRELRKPGETGYKVPHGGMFCYVSGANFFGEILEWIGYALAMGGALPGSTFALCTVCNIGPRAIQHHRWYLQKFKDEYPKERRALIPFVF